MIKLFLYAGPFAWPLLVLAAVVLVLPIRETLALFRDNTAKQRRAETRPNTIFFGGSISLAIGFFGHHVGIYIATQAISRAGAVETGILAAGYGESLLPLLFGMVIFIFSALVWFVLRWRFRLLGGI